MSYPAPRAALSAYVPYGDPYADPYSDSHRRIRQAKGSPVPDVRRYVPLHPVTDPCAPRERSVGPEWRSDYYEVSYPALRLKPVCGTLSNMSTSSIWPYSVWFGPAKTPGEIRQRVSPKLYLCAIATRELTGLARRIRLRTDAAPGHAEVLNESASYADRVFFPRKRRRQ